VVELARQLGHWQGSVQPIIIGHPPSLMKRNQVKFDFVLTLRNSSSLSFGSVQ
jgi:hypothetical protein